MKTPAEFIGLYAAAGEAKASAGAARLLLLSVLAGFMIAMGGAVTATATYAIENASAARIISGLLFPFGLIMVIITGAELFTGNCLITISVLEGRAPLRGMARNLVIVYIGNFIGALLTAAACAFSGQISASGGALAAAAIRTAAAKCSLGFADAFILGIMCNLLVCLGVVCALSADRITGRSVGAYVPVAFFVICGFEHCVANMYYVPAGLFAAGIERYAALAAEFGINADALTWGNFIFKNLVPVTLGNIAGGAALGALLWAAQKK